MTVRGDASLATSSPPTETATLDVGGMTCAACQANVQRALTRKPGVVDASVNLMTGEARVTFDPAVIGIPQLVTAVEDVGYDASPALRNRPLSATFDTGDEMGATGTRAAVALVSGGAAMALSMPGMVPHAPWLLSGADGVRDDLGRTPLLRQRRPRADPPCARHEQPGGGRHRRRVPVFGRRDGVAGRAGRRGRRAGRCITRRW